MQATINIEVAALDYLGITVEEFQQAAIYALGNLAHPATGAPIYINDVRVTVIADCPEIAIR